MAQDCELLWVLVNLSQALTRAQAFFGPLESVVSTNTSDSDSEPVGIQGTCCEWKLAGNTIKSSEESTCTSYGN